MCSDVRRHFSSGQDRCFLVFSYIIVIICSPFVGTFEPPSNHLDLAVEQKF